MATYMNTVTGETYELGIELTTGESLLRAAWGRGMRVACLLNGWNANDVTVL
jgi:hypothetical protein